MYLFYLFFYFMSKMILMNKEKEYKTEASAIQSIGYPCENSSNGKDYSGLVINDYEVLYGLRVFAWPSTIKKWVCKKTDNGKFIVLNDLQVAREYLKKYSDMFGVSISNYANEAITSRIIASGALVPENMAKLNEEANFINKTYEGVKNA